MFYYDKKVIVRRYKSSLGEYNRPTHKLEDVGEYSCTVQQKTNSTNSLQPQKENFTGWMLYTEYGVDIRLGDICYIYELDEYGEIILSTEMMMVADKPYRKRDHMEIPLTFDEEV